MAHIQTVTKTYSQDAIVATVEIDPSSLPPTAPYPNTQQSTSEGDPNGYTYNSKIAYQRYTKYGPLALLPLWNNYYSIVWSVNSKDTKMVKGWSPDMFLSELNKEISTPPNSIINQNGDDSIRNEYDVSSRRYAAYSSVILILLYILL
jgi:2-polyprenyl-6-methoxyphenol hydroxylase-like FAD-dependent oxidoreductase